jgi:hypothetical protein
LEENSAHLLHGDWEENGCREIEEAIFEAKDEGEKGIEICSLVVNIIIVIFSDP